MSILARFYHRCGNAGSFSTAARAIALIELPFFTQYLNPRGFLTLLM